MAPVVPAIFDFRIYLLVKFSKISCATLRPSWWAVSAIDASVDSNSTIFVAMKRIWKDRQCAH